MRAAVMVLWLAGCGSSTEPVIDAGTPDLAVEDDFAVAPICTDSEIGDAGVAPTFTHVQRVFDNSCVLCHCCGDALTLTSGMSYSQLVGRMAPNSVRSVDESCGGVLVTPGNPAASYLYQKISTLTPCAGQPMPLPEVQFVPLPQCQQDLIRRWIEAGAPND
jgi:hypothetical protein